MSTEVVNESLRKIDTTIAQGQLQVAMEMVDALLLEHPAQDDLLFRRFRLLRAQGNFDDAFVTSLAFSPGFKANSGVTFEILMTLPRLRNIPINEQTEAELCRILEIENLDCHPIWRIIYGFFQRRVAQSRHSSDFLAALSQNALFNATLRHFSLWDQSLEVECVAIRRQLLARVEADINAAAPLGRLMLSMAMQCVQNEYVYFVSDEEAAAVASLRARLKAARDAGRALAPADQLGFLILLMYVSPEELLDDRPLDPAALDALDGEVVEFVQARLAERELIRRYTDDFLAPSPPARNQSRHVAQRYDLNPYPRWTKGPLNVNVQARQYQDLLGLNRCPAWNDSKGDTFRRMLVAGCGTGRHPTQNAVMFPWLEITAVDISAACLGYARLMAERLDIANMRFELGDIMAMDSWDRQFDIIECLGVLHHLEDPEAGLRNMVDLLVPGGVMKLGYYSRSARQNITRLRRERPDQGDLSDADYIRGLRHRLMSEPEYQQYADILELGDFYTTSGASNVLLHEQEAQYTIPQLQQVLDDHDLQFLSFIEEDKPRFEAAGGQGSPFELMNWHPLEEKNPKFFAGMYEFYCQKKA